MNIDPNEIRSLWVKRPRPLNQARTHLEIHGVHIDQAIQFDDSVLWAIRSGTCDCLGRDGQWIIEPLPSSRDDDYIQRYRFSSIDEAITFAYAAQSGD